MKTTIVKLLALILIAAFFAPSDQVHIRAADSCNPASAIEAANKLKSTGDQSKDVKVLQDAISQARDAVIDCGGIRLKGNGDKVTVVEIPAGLYLGRPER